jgi:hypothetical protein
MTARSEPARRARAPVWVSVMGLRRRSDELPIRETMARWARRGLVVAWARRRAVAFALEERARRLRTRCRLSECARLADAMTVQKRPD